MSYQIIVHIPNSEPIIAEVEELPSLDDTIIKIKNPTYVDGKEIPYIQKETITVYWPVNRISFIEVVTEEKSEKIFGFVRE